MPDLQHTLQGNDLGFLKMVAGNWGIELTAPDVATGLPILVNALLNKNLVNEIVEALPAEAEEALRALLENEGRLSWAVFTRRFGEVRVMGAGRRDRERPDLKPVSPAEVLWYRALIGKAFLGAAPEPQEFAYIPEDLLELMNPIASSAPAPLGRASSPGESAHAMPATDHILDQATTLLAALRLGLDAENLAAGNFTIPVNALQAILRSAGLLDKTGMPLPEQARAFLEAPRGEALAVLARGWMDSKAYNELRLLPGLKFEGEWANDPLAARQVLLKLLSQLPTDRWWNLHAFVNGVAENFPDFQRPAGDYDSWFIRRESDGQFLRGIQAWDEVDGAVIRAMITGPMHWLGIYDLAAPSAEGEPASFRPGKWAEPLWHGAAPRGLAEEKGQVRVSSDGVILVNALAPRAVRYQIARFGEWEVESGGAFRYRLTPGSLERARQQGLKPAHLTALLKKHLASPIPPALLQALERWEKFGAQAHIEKAVLLRVQSPEALTALRQSRAARYLGEMLGADAVVIKPGGEEAVLRALAESGYLAEEIQPGKK